RGRLISGRGRSRRGGRVRSGGFGGRAARAGAASVGEDEEAEEGEGPEHGLVEAHRRKVPWKRTREASTNITCRCRDRRAATGGCRAARAPRRACGAGAG